MSAHYCPLPSALLVAACDPRPLVSVTREAFLAELQAHADATADAAARAATSARAAYAAYTAADARAAYAAYAAYTAAAATADAARAAHATYTKMADKLIALLAAAPIGEASDVRNG